MEHIALPGSAGAHWRSSYLGEQYDGGPFESYPARLGWTLRTFSRPKKEMVILRHGSRPTTSAVVSFLQTWLYFGMIHEALKGFADQNDFLDKDADGAVYLTTKRLEHVFSRCSVELLASIFVSGAQDFMRSLTISAGCLTRVQQTMTQILMSEPELLDDRFVIALAVVHEAITWFLCDLAKQESMDDSPLLQTPWGRKRSGVLANHPADPLLAAMRGRGWCPYDLALLRNEATSVTSTYYYSGMRPRMASRSHLQCDSKTCAETMVVASTFRLKHVEDQCPCQTMMVDNKALCALINEEQLPVIEIVGSEDSFEIQLILRAKLPQEDFVAISHVWAEGLGNPLANGLPTCQLLQLRHWISNLRPTSPVLPIWLDTLLVPIRPPEAQQKALANIRAPYEQAQSVLVLDSYLWRLEEKALDLLELFAALSCCTWTQRVWTLQEARLGSTVLFQFADHAIELSTAFKGKFREHHPRFKWSPPLHPHRRLQFEIVALYQGHIWDRDILGAIPEASVCYTRFVIKRRIISVSTDEPLCLASLLNKDIEVIARTAPSERMAALWRQLTNVSVGFLFSHAPRKLDAPGLHWAPDTFLGWCDAQRDGDNWFGTIKELDRDESATVTVSGLKVRLQGIRFRPGVDNMTDRYGPETLARSVDTTSFERNIYLRDSRSGLWYYLYWHVSDCQPWSDKRLPIPPTSGSAVILDDVLPREKFAVPSVLDDDVGRGFSGVLVSQCVEKQVGSDLVIYGKGDRHVYVVSVSSVFQVVYDVVWRIADEILKQKGSDYWFVTPDIVKECKLKAEAVLNDKSFADAFELYNVDHALEITNSIERLGMMIAEVGARMDLLWFDATDETQQWCVD